MRTIIHDQTYDDSRAGRPVWGCCRHAPARVNLLHGQGCVSQTPTGRGFGPGIFPALSQFDGIGKRSTAPLANLIHNAADHSGNDAVEPLKRHFKVSVRYVPKRSPGARNEVTRHQSIWYPHDR